MICGVVGSVPASVAELDTISAHVIDYPLLQDLLNLVVWQKGLEQTSEQIYILNNYRTTLNTASNTVFLEVLLDFLAFFFWNHV